MEVFSFMMDKARISGNFSGIQLPNNGPCVSHLLYADDAIIIGEWSRENVFNVIRILRIFHICSGIKINLAKSNIFAIGVGAGDLNITAGLIGCQVGNFPFRYLGLAVGGNMNRIINWKPIYEVFDARLAKWKSSLLSFGERITLIKSVLDSLPCYYLSLYKAPVKVIKDLESKIRNFLWGGDGSIKKLHWVAWDRVSLPKNCGGLGLSCLKNTNISLLAKWGWRFLKFRDRLWAKAINAIHSSRAGWDFIPAKKALGGVWCNIVQVMTKTTIDGSPLRNFFKAEVGDGSDTAFWLDPWIANVPLKEKFPHLFKLESVKGCRVKDRIPSLSEGQRYLWAWKKPPSTDLELNDLVALCSALFIINLNQSCDVWSWIGADDKDFSVSAVKRLLNKQRSQTDHYVIEDCNWVPLKCNAFVWRAEMGRIATLTSLKKRNIGTDNLSCCLCGEEDETADHLFTTCCFASMVWSFVCSWSKSQNFIRFFFKDLLEAHNYVGLIDQKKEVLKGIIRIGCWCIWKARNEAKFNNTQVKLERIISEIRSLGFFLVFY
ncbi:putative RNA-directed DNA polymerase [Helianthus debilis subsp. tardiflorus]